MKAIEAGSKSTSAVASLWSEDRKKETFFSLRDATKPFFSLATIQPKLKIGQPNDEYEQEADRVADAVMRVPDPAVQRQPMEEEEKLQMKRWDPGVQLKCKECEEEDNLQRKAEAKASDSATSFAGHILSSQIKSTAGNGSPLSEGVQSEMGNKIGADFSGVAIHTDSKAIQMNQELGAKAFTHGSDIYFNQGQYNPASTSGRYLLAHELTHVVQQTAKAPNVQLQDDTATSPVLGVNDIIPFPADSQVALGRILPDEIMQMVRQVDSESAAMADAIDRQVGVVRVSSPEKFEANIAGPVRRSRPGEQADQMLEDIRVVLARDGSTFTFSVSARVQGLSERITLSERSGLEAEHRDGAIVMSSVSGEERTRQLRVRETDSGAIRLGVFGESIEGVPGFMAGRVFEAIEMTRLEPAETNAEIERQVERIAEAREGARRERSQEISVGGGVGFTDSGEPLGLLTSSWRIRFPTTDALVGMGLNQQAAAVAGNIVQIPVEMQVLYAPDSTILGTIGTGVDVNIPTEIPVNIRLILAGIGAGSFEPEPGGERQLTFGLPLGVGVGTEIGIFRLNLRYDALFNLLPRGTSLHGITGSAGISF